MMGNVRRKPDTLLPLETTILEVALALQRRGEAEFHGFAVAKEIAEKAEARMLTAHGTLYKALARLERDGLLERQACPSDARGTLAVLTDLGLARLRAAWPTHLRGVAEHVTGRLSPEEVVQLSGLLAKLVDDTGSTAAPGGCGGDL